MGADPEMTTGASKPKELARFSSVSTKKGGGKRRVRCQRSTLTPTRQRLAAPLGSAAFQLIQSCQANCRQIEPESGSQAPFQCLCGGHLEEWLFRRDALGVTVWRRAKSPIIGQLAGWPFAFGVVCGLIRTAGAPNSPLRALSGRHRAAFQHDQAAHVVRRDSACRSWRRRAGCR